jgi:dienelactone hydrolase
MKRRHQSSEAAPLRKPRLPRLWFGALEVEVDTMAGQWIDIAAADGGSFKGYLTVPASGSGPGILLLQEIFGVNASMREVADYYADEGYIVLAPDLFWRLELPRPNSTRRLAIISASTPISRSRMPLTR